MDEVQLRRLGPSGVVIKLNLSESNNFKCCAGRGSTCQIWTRSKYASRTHFSISYSNGKYVIADLKSANGTFVNDVKIKSEQILEFGNIISVGVPSDLHQIADCIVYVFEKCSIRDLNEKGNKTAGEVSHGSAVLSEVNKTRENLIHENGESSNNQHDSNQEGGEPSEDSSALPSPEIQEIHCRTSESTSLQEKKLDEFEESIDEAPNIAPQINNLINRLDDKEVNGTCNSLPNEKVTEETNEVLEEEKDIFSPENEDEDLEAYNACTQVDEIKQEPVSQEWSRCEEIIEISDSEDENWLESLSQSQELKKAKQLNDEEQVEEEEDDVVFLESIPRSSNFDFSRQIKKELDDKIPDTVLEEEDLSEVDRAWVGKLFKSQEKFKEVRLLCSQQEDDLIEEVEDAIEEDQGDVSKEKDDQMETFQDITKIPDVLSNDNLVEPENSIEKHFDKKEDNLLTNKPSCSTIFPLPKDQTPEENLTSPCSSRTANRSRSNSLSSISSSEDFSSPSLFHRKPTDSFSSVSSEEDIFEDIEAQQKKDKVCKSKKEVEEKSSSLEVKECFVILERITHEDNKTEVPEKKSPKRSSAGSFSPRKDQSEVLTKEDIDRQKLDLNVVAGRKRLFNEEYDSDEDYFVVKKNKIVLPKTKSSISNSAPINIENFKKAPSILDIRKKKRKTKTQSIPAMSPSSRRRLLETRKDKLKALAEKKKLEEEERKKDEDGRNKILPSLKVKNTVKSRGDFLCEENLEAATGKAGPSKKKLKITPVKFLGCHGEPSYQKYPSPERVDVSKPKYPPPEKVSAGKPDYPDSNIVNGGNETDEEADNKGLSFEKALLGGVQNKIKRRTGQLNSSRSDRGKLTEKSNSVTEKIPEAIPQPSGKENLPHVRNDLVIRTELKSCLKTVCNYMRNIRPLAPEKKVRFDDSKKEVKYYERDNEKSMRKLRTTKLTVIENGELKYRHMIYQICNWNANWLEECKKVPPEEYPPIHNKQETPKKLPQKFNSHAQYMKSFLPLLLMDLWITVSSNWRANGHLEPKYIIACTSYVDAPIEDKTESLSYFYCEGILPCTLNGQCAKEGDLVTIQLIQIVPESCDSLSQNSGKKLGTLAFGFVETKEIEKIVPNTKIHRALAEKTVSISQENYLFKLKILLKRRKNFKIDMNTTMQLTVVQPITGELRLFRGVCYLPQSPLCRVILAPNRPDLVLAEPLKKNKIVFRETLDTIQQDLVFKLATSCFKTSPSLHVIQGGPGTGKTHVMIALILQLLLGDEGKNSTRPKIIYCTSSNGAADEMAYKLKQYRQTLCKTERFKLVRYGLQNLMRPEVKDISSHALALNNKNKEKLEEEKKLVEAKINHLVLDLGSREKFTETECEHKEKELNHLVRVKESINQGRHPKLSTHASLDAESLIVEKADIVCTTCSSSGTMRLIATFNKILMDKNNQHIICIVDDAMQSKEVESILPLMLGVNKLILVGDRHQLKPSIKSKKAHDFGFNRSLFGRILDQFDKAKENISPIFNLRIQYRMNSNVLEYPNQTFYNNQLRNGLIGVNPKISRIKPYMVFVNSEENVVPNGEKDIREAKFVEILLKIIVRHLVQPFNIAVIASNLKKANFIKFRLKNILTSNIEVNVVEKFQGREFNAVIFLNDGSALQPGALNLALTRAKDLLYVAVLCDLTTQVNSHFAKLIDDGTNRKVVQSLGKQITEDEIFSMVEN